MILFNSFFKWKDSFFCQIAENKDKKNKKNKGSTTCCLCPAIQNCLNGSLSAFSYEPLKREVTSMKVSTLQGIVKPPIG
jgi:hypothetical protein